MGLSAENEKPIQTILQSTLVLGLHPLQNFAIFADFAELQNIERNKIQTLHWVQWQSLHQAEMTLLSIHHIGRI